MLHIVVLLARSMPWASLLPHISCIVPDSYDCWDGIKLYAAKCMPRDLGVDLEYIKRELLIHRGLSHKCIIRFHRCILCPSHLIILLEYASGGELFAAIEAVGRLNEDGALYFFKQLVAGVEYLHNTGIVHRDIKVR